MTKINDELETSKVELDALLAQLKAIADAIPNLPSETTPVGRDENDNVDRSPLGHPARVQLPGARSHRSRRSGQGRGLQERRQALRCPLRGDEGSDCPPAPRPGAVHAGPAHPAARLHRMLRALPGEPGQPVRHRPAAQVLPRICSTLVSRAKGKTRARYASSP